MRAPRSWCALVLLLPTLAAQLRAQRPDQQLLSEQRVVGGSGDSVTLDLTQKTFYLLEVAGWQGEPVVAPTRPHQRTALVTPAGRATDGSARFEVYPGWTGLYVVHLAGLADGSEALVRLYGDSVTTRRAAVHHDEGLAVGLSLGIGAHSGYRIDPTGGQPPGGGGDFEGCVVAQSGSRFSACLGLASQRFPDADLTVTWYFIEPRLTLWSGSLLGTARTDVAVSLRIAQGGETRPRNISPSQLAPGLLVVHHLAPDGRRRGWNVWLGYSHGRLGNVPETEFRDTDRVTAGLAWVP